MRCASFESCTLAVQAECECIGIVVSGDRAGNAVVAEFVYELDAIRGVVACFGVMTEHADLPDQPRYGNQPIPSPCEG
jgi:hypothetical protein